MIRETHVGVCLEGSKTGFLFMKIVFSIRVAMIMMNIRK